MFDPLSYRESALLKDGTPITIRSIQRDDRGGILDAFNRLDKASIYRRFFRLKKELTASELEQLTDDDTGRVVALVVTTQTEYGELLMGGGRFVVGAIDASQTASLTFLTDAFEVTSSLSGPGGLRSGIEPWLIRSALMMMRLSAACRNTSMRHTTDRALDEMMSARTWPGPTEGSWSMSPTINMAALPAFMSVCISMTSTMEVSPIGHGPADCA
jgi:hypothetical protein